jgi:hypothetical protein
MPLLLWLHGVIVIPCSPLMKRPTAMASLPGFIGMDGCRRGDREIPGKFPAEQRDFFRVLNVIPRPGFHNKAHAGSPV